MNFTWGSNRCGKSTAFNIGTIVMLRCSTTKLSYQGLLKISVVYKINEGVDCTVQEVQADSKIIVPAILIDLKSQPKTEVIHLITQKTYDKEKEDNKKSLDHIISGQLKLCSLCIIISHFGTDSSFYGPENSTITINQNHQWQQKLDEYDEHINCALGQRT